RAAGSSCSASTSPRSSASTASSPTSPRPSPAPTTTGSPTSAARTRRASSAPRWWRPTTSPPRWRKRGARSSSSASAPSSSPRAASAAARGTIRTTIRSGPNASGSGSRSPLTAAVSLTAGGVLERFPRLRVALLEGNCAWAPWLFHRLDEHWEWVGRYEAPELRRKPSEYFRTNCFLAVEADERPVAHYVEWFGDDNLVFSTDYPHADSKYPHAVDAFFRLPLSPASQRKILWENWARLYGITAS